MRHALLALALCLAAAGIGTTAAPDAAAAGISVRRTGPSVPAPRPVPQTQPPPVAVSLQALTPPGQPVWNSIDDPASIWVVVNKSRPLNPIDYAPSDLVVPPVPDVNDQPVRQVVAGPLAAMFQAAQAEAGLSLTLQSGYRSYGVQSNVYANDLDAHGQAYADTDTARPGHSEHQTGLAVDISAASGDCSLQQCFGQTPDGQWLATNAWRFGFLLRYPADKVPVTGFEYEPWHFRYIGVPLATELHNTGVQTLEEYFHVPGGTTYPG